MNAPTAWQQRKELVEASDQAKRFMDTVGLAEVLGTTRKSIRFLTVLAEARGH